MRIAMVGTRGIPASYSGFETCVEEVSVRLAAQGHQVTVYCRSHHQAAPADTYRGIHLVQLPSIRNKYLDTLVHSTLSCLHLLRDRPDIVMLFIVGNAPVAIIPRLAGLPVAINVDGLDWQRAKWPAPAKKYLQLAEWLATKFANTVVTDSQAVVRYYQRRYQASPTYIAYGANTTQAAAGAALSHLGLEPGQYLLYVGRLVPENCAEHLIAAFRLLEASLPPTIKVVIVGDAPYADDYIAALRQHASNRIILPGYIFGDAYWELLNHPFAYVFTSGASGTHPALLEAMAVGNCVIAQATPTNVETGGDAILYYDGQQGGHDLAGQLQRIVHDPALRTAYGRRAAQRVAAHYNWDTITRQYLALFQQLMRR